MWPRGTGADEWTSGTRDDGGKKGCKKGSRGSKPDWYGDRTREALETRAKARAKVRVKPDTAATVESKGTSQRTVRTTLQRIEQEALSSQSLANAIESIGRTRTEATASRLRLKDGERLYPKSWSSTTPLGGFAREVAAWLGYIDPTHEAGKLIQRITKGRSDCVRLTAATLKTTNYVELDYELAVAQARRSKSHGPEGHSDGPSHGFVAWQALVDGYAPKSSNDPTIALQPTLSTPKRCKDAKKLKERLTAWSLKVAEYEHQFKTINEAQKMFVLREMVPKDIKREFLRGP